MELAEKPLVISGGGGGGSYFGENFAGTRGGNADPFLNVVGGGSSGAAGGLLGTGSSTGLSRGTRLTPYVRYSTSGAFKKGKATIRVQSDGTFRWTRLISKSRPFQAYVSYRNVESNMRMWVKVR
jgi:hypothetical protein